MNSYITETVQKGIQTIVVAIIILIFCFALREGIKKQEINECNNWAKMAEKYDGFYLTKAEATQCNFLNIEIKAPIK